MDCSNLDDYCNDDDYDNEYIEIGFSTAWSPPELIVEKLRENHPEANIMLVDFEPGCDFCGINSDDEKECYEFSNKNFECYDEELKSYIMEEQEGCSFILDEEYFEEE
jgi:hypothetical protein